MTANKSLADKLYYDGEREYDVRKGDIRYLDGSSLKRRNKMSGGRRLFVALVAVVAIGIGGVFLYNTIITPMLEAQNIQHATEENLKRPAGIDTIPIMTEVINLSDDEIRELFNYEPLPDGAGQVAPIRGEYKATDELGGNNDASEER